MKDQSCDSNFSSIKFLSASSYFQIGFVCLSFVGFIGNFCSYCAMITIESLIIDSWLVKSRSMHDEVLFVTLVGSFIIFLGYILTEF